MGESTRERIAAFVEAEPGQHFSAIGRQLDIATGQVQYHVRRLRDAGTIEGRSVYGQTHYYPPDIPEWDRRALALARRETSRDVLLDLVRHGSARPAAVAERIGVARSTLEYHLDRLVEQDIVRKERESKAGLVLVIERPEATVRILRTVEPSLPQQFVDRFERLVDHLLEGG